MLALLVARRMQRGEHGAHGQHFGRNFGEVDRATPFRILDPESRPSPLEDLADLPPPRRRVGPVTREREIEQDNRTPDRLKLRLLRAELAMCCPDQEPENKREQCRVEARHRADHPLGRRDISVRQQRLQTEPDERAREGHERYDRGAIHENHRLSPSGADGPAAYPSGLSLGAQAAPPRSPPTPERDGMEVQDAMSRKTAT